MNDGDALLKAILTAPDEDTPRLIYADWLDENGQPERAELIRVQIELSRRLGENSREEIVESDRDLVRLCAREKTLLTLHREEWLASLRESGALESHITHGQFRRGFVEIVWMPAGYFLKRADLLFRTCPVRELRITVASHSQLLELFASPHLARLETLDLSDRSLENTVAHVLFQSGQYASVKQLRVLRLRGCGITDQGAQWLAGLPFEWPLRELDLAFNPIGETGLEALRNRYGQALRTTPEL